MSRSLTIAGLAAMLAAVISQEGRAEGLESGTPAPDFVLTDTSGQQHSLADYRGKYVVLEWVNHGCPFVRKHYDSGNMQSLQREFTGRDVIWLSISSSAHGKQGHYSPEEWTTLIGEKNAASTAVLLDRDGTVGKQYGAKTTPHMYVIDPQGVLIYQGAIDDKPSTDKEDIAGAQNYVRAALESSMAGQPVASATTRPYGCGIKY